MSNLNSNTTPQVGDINNDTIDNDLSMFTVNNQNDPLINIDPDLNALYKIDENLKTSNEYYTETSFNAKFNDNEKQFSILNTNIRSIPKNLSGLELILQTFKHSFSLISCTENWLKETNVNLYNLKNYVHEYNIREKKTRRRSFIICAN